MNTQTDYEVINDKDYKIVDEITWNYWLNKYEGTEVIRPVRHVSDYGYEIDTLFQAKIY